VNPFSPSKRATSTSLASSSKSVWHGMEDFSKEGFLKVGDRFLSRKPWMREERDHHKP